MDARANLFKKKTYLKHRGQNALKPKMEKDVQGKY